MVDFARMLSLEDERWIEFTGGYRVRFHVRPLLAKLETDPETAATWHELWEELHHQGDVGVASYAAVPHLVRIHRKRGIIDWNTYAMVAIIELARTAGNNPDMPKWLEEDYLSAIRELAGIGAAEILHTEDPYAARAILSILAVDSNTTNE